MIAWVPKIRIVISAARKKGAVGNNCLHSRRQGPAHQGVLTLTVDLIYKDFSKTENAQAQGTNSRGRSTAHRSRWTS